MAGAEKTFSGESPCALCKKVKEGRQKEEKLPATVKANKKAEGFLVSFRDFLKQPYGQEFSYPKISDRTLVVRSNAPPSPVPRSVFA